MNFNDMYKPAGLLGAIGAAAAVGLAVGFAVARDPRLLRRLAGAAARGVGRAQLALAETTEEVIDMWEDVREQARREMEDARFEAAGRRAAQASAAAAPAAPATESGEPGEPGAGERPRPSLRPRTRKPAGAASGAAAGNAAKRPARKRSSAASAALEAIPRAPAAPEAGTSKA